MQKEVDRDSRYRRLYGLTRAEYEQAISQPCSICGEKEKPREIDHDHQTGRVRGPLCRRCNFLEGVISNAGKEIVLALVEWSFG